MASSQPITPSSAIAQLCPACGLCCNGVLFADVELRRGDDPKRLAALGLRLEEKGGKLAFAQPCACYDGQRCRAYADRPTRCRAFECRILKRVQRGELSTRAALTRIARARAQVQEARELIRASGGSEEDRALTSAYSEVMAQPIDLGRPGPITRSRRKLASLMHQLMTFLHGEFMEPLARPD